MFFNSGNVEKVRQRRSRSCLRKSTSWRARAGRVRQLGLFEHFLLLLIIHGIWQNQSAMKEFRIIQQPHSICIGSTLIKVKWHQIRLHTVFSKAYSTIRIFSRKRILILKIKTLKGPMTGNPLFSCPHQSFRAFDSIKSR